MGAGGSKTSPGASQHVFEATGARTTFSGDLVTSLQDSTSSDSTRSAALEQRIQERLTAELQKIADAEAERVNSLISSATSDTPQISHDDNSTSEDSEESNDPSLLQRLTGRGQQSDKMAELSNSSVSKEIAELKKKLEGRKKVEKPDAGVLRAKDELVACLRTNDRRPLDCWKEKENFKREVARLEQEFVQKTVR